MDINNQKLNNSNGENTQSEIVITKDMNLGEVVFKYPEAAEVLTDYGLSCVGCFASSFDSIEQGAKVHQLSDEELDEMLARINEVVNFGE